MTALFIIGFLIGIPVGWFIGRWLANREWERIREVAGL